MKITDKKLMTDKPPSSELTRVLQRQQTPVLNGTPGQALGLMGNKGQQWRQHHDV